MIATIVATLVFAGLNFLSGVLLEQQGIIRALLSALWKAAVYAAVFYILFGLTARLFGLFDDR